MALTLPMASLRPHPLHSTPLHSTPLRTAKRFPLTRVRMPTEPLPLVFFLLLFLFPYFSEHFQKNRRKCWICYYLSS
jgi:hypothetical protein